MTVHHDLKATIDLPVLAACRDRVATETSTSPRADKPRLTTAQINEIVRRRLAGERAVDLASDFGVHRTTIHRYRGRKN